MNPTRPEKCLRCGSPRVAAITYDASPTAVQVTEDLRSGRAVPAGRAPTGNDPRWRCLKCKFEWGHPRGLSGSSSDETELA